MTLAQKDVLLVSANARLVVAMVALAIASRIAQATRKVQRIKSIKNS